MIPLKDQEYLRAQFAQALIHPVKIEFFTQKELGIFIPGRQPCPYCKPTQEMLQELAALSDKISLRIHIREEEPTEAARYGIDKIPAIALHRDGLRPEGGRESRPLKFFGMPAGTEFPAFVETIIDLSGGHSFLSDESKKALRKVKRDIRLQVFVTPT